MILTQMSHFDDVMSLIYNIFSSLIGMLDDTTFIGGFSILDFLLACLVLTIIFAIFINTAKIKNVD